MSSSTEKRSEPQDSAKPKDAKEAGPRKPAFWERYTLAEVFSACKRVPLIGTWLFGFVVGVLGPFSASISASFREVSSTTDRSTVRLTLPDRRSNRNHLSCIHASALFCAAETASAMCATVAGVALSRAAEAKGDARKVGVIPSGAQIDYVKKARGPIGVECVVEHAEMEKALDAGKEMWVVVSLRDKDGKGDKVSELRLRCNLKRMG
ncbi:hypothetical protein DFJ74DRAFT_713672 [Hyaloraphidium curvatum]|nr:hypothetical protein DFJ74DRAFT_713672 [Hyaloraphidium curvatum]